MRIEPDRLRAMSSATQDRSMLICRVDSCLYGLPLDHVIETMRPLPVEPLAGAPDFVLGLSMVRGEPVPVLDASRLFGTSTGTSRRLVSIDTNGRHMALAVDSVVGIRKVGSDTLQDLSPVLECTCSDAVRSLAPLDAELLRVLEETRLVPDSVWELLDRSPSQ
jgi:purine-binding chemotaxis protein CheW